MSEFLTEDNLHSKLEKLFPKAQEIKRNKKRGMDYVISIKANDVPPKIENIIEECIESDCSYADEEYEIEDNWEIYIEYDGHHHFSDNGQVIKDKQNGGFSSLKRMGCEELILRIPYFVQLNKEINQHWFGLDLDLSDDYKHGFIDKYTILPSRFCRGGENAFKEHMNNLPLKVAIDIYNSLKTKVKSNNFDAVGSKYLWKYMIEKFDKETFDLIKPVLNTCPISGDTIITEKFYKHALPHDLDKVMHCSLATFYFNCLNSEDN